MNPALQRALDVCASEPIHLSGAIQPHGFLVSCALPDWTVRHVSANIESLLGVPVEGMLRHSLREFFTDDVIRALADTAALTEPGAVTQRAAVANIGPSATLCDLSVHCVDGLIHIEIEPQPPGTSELSPTITAQNMIARVANASTPDDFFDGVAAQVKRLTGYDRVMVYRFRHDDAGEVVAEACEPDMGSFLGVRFPASDIPPQARALYVSNRIRVIPDAGYSAVPIVPDRDQRGAPLDLGQNMLRSVSPVHLEYLRNMGVAASMSISITVGGRLWGLVACHLREPRLVPPGVRAAADLFGLFASMRVAAREQHAAEVAEEHARAARDTLAIRLQDAAEPRRALLGELALLCRTVPADGVAVWMDHRWHAHGHTPDGSAMPRLQGWISRVGPNAGIASTHLADHWAAGAGTNGIAGVLAIEIFPGSGEWVLFFRREQVEQVRWAGRPDRPFQVSEDGQRIGPRSSFEAWVQTVRDSSVPWTDGDRRLAERLRRVLHQRQHRGHGATGPSIGDLAGQRVRSEVRDQRDRLVRLSSLLEGLVHLDAEETTRLAAHIGALETELRALARIPEAKDSA